MEDNRVILDFQSVSYTVIELHNIYTDCKKKIWDIRNNLHELYTFFNIIPRNNKIQSRAEVIGELAKLLDILVCSVPDKDSHWCLVLYSHSHSLPFL